MRNVYLTKNALGQECIVQFQYGSTNGKTGNAVQVWILPLEWIKNGKSAMEQDEASCMDCPHSKRANKTCYVRKGNSEMGLKSKVNSLHKAYLSGDLQVLPMSEAKVEVSNCTGKFIRFGAYGEPVLLGEDIVLQLTAVAKNWTGYTHQWHMPQYQWAKRFFMASVETEGLQSKANGKGFRTFRVRRSADIVGGGEVMCPASKEMGNRTTCNKCGLCKGTSSKAKSITIIKH